MAKAAKRTKRAGPSEPLMADRLLALFGFELAALERSVAPLKDEVASIEAGEGVPRDAAAGAKGRIEALGHLVRTLEKLLELKQVEALSLAGGGDAPDAEAERLAAELMRRLRVLDRRRRVLAPDGQRAASTGAPEPKPGEAIVLGEMPI